MIDLKEFGLTRAQALCALFNSARTQGLGILQYDSKHVMNVKEAETLLEKTKYFDYVEGRVLKVSLEKDEFDERLYDRDNGFGAAFHALLDYATTLRKEN